MYFMIQFAAGGSSSVAISSCCEQCCKNLSLSLGNVGARVPPLSLFIVRIEAGKINLLIAAKGFSGIRFKRLRNSTQNL